MTKAFSIRIASIASSILRCGTMGLLSCILAIFILSTGFAGAQTSVTGDIAGHMVDATGASVVNATLTLKNLGDGSSQKVTTDKTGNYRFALLRPGLYSIHAEGSGLTADVTSVAVNVGQGTPVDLLAKPEGNTTTIDVTSGQPLLQVGDANISTTFSATQMDLLPIPGGDISNLPFSTPGASLSTGDDYGNFTVFGLPGTSNLFTTNGSDLMDAYLNLPNSGASNNVLGANEIQEAAVVVNGYTGQYGRLAGAQVNYTTKSGTNNFHGNANFFYNSTAFNANDWFLKEKQIDAKVPNQAPHAVSRQWSGSFGGPIWKNKLFGFFDDEGLRYVLPGGGSVIHVPSAAFQAATLANIALKQPSELAFYKNIFALYSGANGFASATPSNSADGGCGDFAGTVSGGVTFNGTGTGTPCSANFVPNNNNLNTEQLYAVRLDANISAKDQVNARFKHDWGVQATSTDPINSAFSANSVQPEFEGQLNETHIFSANIVNTATIASLYYSAIFGPPNFAAATATFPTTFKFTDGDAFDNLGGGNLANGSSGDDAYPQGRNVSQYQVTDDFSATHGRNSIKTGFNFRRYNITNYAALADATGATTFGSNTDFYNGIISSAHSGTSTTTLAFPQIAQVHLALYSISAYVQDQVAFTPNLNVTASLRFDRSADPSCGRSCFVRLAAPFDQLPHGASIPYNQSILTGQSNAFNDVEKVTIQPRVGFAYTPFGPKTVIRGGAGVFADLPVASVLTRFITSAPNAATFQLAPAAGATYTVQPGLSTSSYVALQSSNTAFQSGFKQGLTLAQIQANVLAAGSKFNTPSYTASTTNKLLNPKFIEYNFEVQHAVTAHDVVDVNYVGNFGIDILFLNPTANAYAACGTDPCPGGFPDLPATQPDPRFLAVTTLTNNGHSNFNGIVASVRHQSSFGLSGAINYTYSHSLDNTSNGGIEGASAEATYVQTQIDPMSPDKFNYGNADYDVRHNLSANYVWQIPVRSSNMMVKEALGGWTLSGNLFGKSAVPYTVIRGSLSGAYTGSTNAGSVLGAFLGGARGPCNSPGVDSINHCMQVSQFASAVNQYHYGFGTNARNSFRGPSYFDTDMQISKTTSIGEHAKFKFGANLFNLINHPNFGPPNNNLASSGTFGTITEDLPPVSSPYGNFQGAGVSGRIIQVLGGITF